MASVPDPTYISIAEVREQAFVTGLRDSGTVSDGDLTLLLQTAEDQIDAFVGPQRHHPLDANVGRVFPRAQDFRITGTTGGLYEYPAIAVIPYKVSRACLRQVEWLYTQWWPNRATDSLPVQYPVESRDIGGDGSYAEKLARGGINLSEASLSPQAQLLLTGFVSRFAPLGVTDTRTSPPPLGEGSGGYGDSSRTYGAV